MDHDHDGDERCLICENGLEAFHAKLRDDIQRFGRSVVGVFGDERPFVYSIGNKLVSMPELLIVAPGVSLHSMTDLINAFSALQLERASPLADEEYVSLDPAWAPVYVATPSDSVKDELTIQATNAWGRDYEVRQLILSDPERRFPWHPDCAEPYRQQRTHRELNA